MEFADYPLLNTPHLTLLILKTAKEREATIGDVVRRLRAVLRLAKEHPPFADAALSTRLRTIAVYLAEAGLIKLRPDNRILITGAGRRALSDCPAEFDTSDLVGDTEIRRRIRLRVRRQSLTDPRGGQYEAGYNAYRDKREITDNPFHHDTADHLAWEDGWCEARDDALIAEAAHVYPA